MIRLTIDNRSIDVEPGSTILHAARTLGVDIPTMCHRDGLKPSGSCMVCLVKVNHTGQYVPSCATLAEEGMTVESETPDVRQARTLALELLLSDHLGDCIAPCQSICPAHMDIPRMIRQIAAGELRQAIVTVKRDIPLPAVLGRICPDLCEKGCRRSAHDSPISICLLKRYVADVDLASENPYLPACLAKNGKHIAIVGAGPTGLSAAYYLLQKGYTCAIFDDHDQPGGMLRYGVSEEQLPHDVLDAEIALIEKHGTEFRGKTRIDVSSLQKLQEEFDAVFLAVGQLSPTEAQRLGLPASSDGIVTDKQTCRTQIEGVFAAGDAASKNRLAIRAVAEGKAAANSIDQYVQGTAVTGPTRPFSTHIGRLKDGEIAEFMRLAGHDNRQKPSPASAGGLSDHQARIEARRCLHCDCRKQDACKLRDYAELYQAKAARYRAGRRLFEQKFDHPHVIYEPGKCIACGLCVRITEAAREPLGLTFIGRGFDVRVNVPFNKSIREALGKMAAECVEACPTGALAFKDETADEL